MTNAVDTRAPIASTERCDKCGAPAMVRATLSSGELYFCGHHARKAGEKLVVQALEVYDPNRVYDNGPWRTP